MNKKQEVILLNEVVTLEKFLKINDINIFPLCIVLTDDEREEYVKENGSSKFKIISQFYSCAAYDDSYLYLNSYHLRNKIEDGEIFVTKFIDKDEKVKNVDFIAPVNELDQGAPKIVFRKSPRLFFKKADHFSTYKKYDGEDLQNLSLYAMFDHQRSLIRKNI